ncbi:MAG: hypothetical protein AB1650_00325 [Candidatus Omnitrophota bacterium]
MSEQERALIAVGSGSIIESIIGMGAVILSILGLLDIYPVIMLSISTILIGAALLIKGSSVASKMESVVAGEPEMSKKALSQLNTGITSETIAGITGIALGILAMAGMSPQMMIGSAAIVYGAGLIFGSGIDFRLNALNLMNPVHSPQIKRVAEQAVTASADAEIFIGIAAVALGIMSVINIAPLVLQLISMLAIGSILFLTGLSLWSRVFNVFRYR